MGGKVAAALAGLLAIALSALVLLKIVTLYGAARYAAGRAEAEAAQLPGLIAAHEGAARAGLAARDRVIGADTARLDEMTRMLPLLLAANDKVNAYASTAAGGAPCLAADRVRGIEIDRAALFSAAPKADDDDAGPVPAIAVADPAESQFE